MLSNIVLSRTDSIGDMVLAMPVAGALKKYLPGVTIAVLARKYTKDIIRACEHFDVFIDADDFFNKEVIINNTRPEAIIHLITNKKIAKRAAELKIPIRIGTTGRLYHWYTCNKLVWLRRKKSDLHEAQLNLKLLKPFGIHQDFSDVDIAGLYGLTKLQPLWQEYSKLIKKEKFNIVIHPKSQGNGREWSSANFVQLINLLNESDHNIFISGVEKEKPYLQKIIDAVHKPVTNIAGISLAQFISFISAADGVLASGTGPLHIAAALGKNAIGLYPPLPTKNAGRWRPIGNHATFFELNKNCSLCKNTPDFCSCINSIQPVIIKNKLDELAGVKRQKNNNN